MSARRVHTVILSNPSHTKKDRKMKQKSRRPSRSNPSMSDMGRAARVAGKVALGAIAGAAGIQGLSMWEMSPRNMTIAVAAAGAVVGGGLIATGKAPNLGAGILAAGATVAAQRTYALHGVGAYIASMRGPAAPRRQETPGGGRLPAGFTVSDYAPGGFTVADPAQASYARR